jgi:hypothetical protein
VYAGVPLRTGPPALLCFSRTCTWGPPTSAPLPVRTRGPHAPSWVLVTLSACGCARVNAFASLRCSHGDPRRRPSSCSRRLRQVGSIATPNYFCNIQTKHLQHTSETAKHLQHTCETQKNTQVAIANICNMQMRHLQYTYETPETLEIYVCNIPDLLLQHPDETLITYV